MEKLSLEMLEEILSAGIDLNQIGILNLALDTDISGVENIKISSWVQGLKRKGFLSDEFKVTEKGLKILAGEFESKKEKLEKRKEKVEAVKTGFELWWASYPSSDVIVKNGKILFPLDRSTMRQKKDECAAKFEKIIKEGEHTAEDLIGALKYEVDAKIAASIKEGKNKLSFMQNSLTYLNQRTYENVMAVSKLVKPQEIKTTTGSVGI